MTRKLHPGESHPCFVGSGECHINATHEIDGIAGGKEYICAMHLVEFEQLEAIIEAMPPEQLERFKRAVNDAHRQKGGA